MADLREIRKLVIVAMFSDDVLFEKLVLKGGNALEIVHGIVNRGSIDVDFSIEEEFSDVDDIARRIENSLKERFDAAGYVVFDFEFALRPPNPEDPRWGGYRAGFKIIGKEKHAQLAKRSPQDMSRSALAVGARNSTVFKIDISKYEYCGGKEEVDLDDFRIVVYTPEMIAIEKLRAICQQMPEYDKRTATPRARDFYDVFAIFAREEIDLEAPNTQDLARNIFAAKEVPLSLLGRIGETREYHRLGWEAVRDAAVGEILDFDNYFDFVVEQARKLEALWKK